MMSSAPWESDRVLTPEIATAVIAVNFPAIALDGLEYLGSGWEFDAYLTTDGWVFRFPRRAHCQDLLDPERRVLDLVSRFLPAAIAVPRVELVGEPAVGFPYRFAGHRYLPGVPADAVEERVMSTVARDIAAALGAIHSIPEEDARAARVAQMEVNDTARQEWLEAGLATASELRGLDPIVDEASSWVRRMPARLVELEAPLRLIHHDLSTDHVLVDPATGRLTGILDWTDTILGDAARDFVFLVAWRGWGFAEEVLRCYPVAPDAGFRERLRFMSRLLSVIWLAEAHAQGIDLSRHVAFVRNAFA